MARQSSYSRTASLLLVAAGAAAGLALFIAMKPQLRKLSPRPTALKARRTRLLLEPPSQLSTEELLERRVLEVFRNDSMVSERAIDICAVENGGIELTGWVNVAAEVGYAVTLARGVPGVLQVVDHLAVRGREPVRNHSSGNYAAVDPAVATAAMPRAD